MSAKKLLADIIELDSKIGELRDAFDESDAAEQVKALGEVLDRELAAVGEDDPLSIALVRTTDMAIPLGERGAKLLARGLSHSNPDVRRLAGESLLGVAEDGFALIRPAIDFALGAGCPAAASGGWSPACGPRSCAWACRWPPRSASTPASSWP